MCYACMKEIILTNDQIEEITYMYNRSQNRKQIAKQLGISEWSVKKIVHQLPRLYKYIGKRFGRLVVIERRGSHQNGCPIVVCQCDCGNMTDVIVSNLTSNKSRTVSCGCYNKEKSISKDSWPQELKQYIEQEATKRGNDFSLTLEEFKQLCSSNCYYCNGEPSGKMRSGREKRNGIDRINNSIGYELLNCVSCCWNCNRMKGTLSHEEFLSHIDKIHNHQLISYKCF